jgi:hypothetical protein
MRPLSPDERAEILARHPRATEADIERFDALLAERRALARQAAASETGPSARLVDVEAALEEMEARVFPAWDAAIAAVAMRRVAADDAEDDGFPVS